MTNSTKIIVGLLASAMLFACTSKKQENKTGDAQVEATATVASTPFGLDTNQSEIRWVGKKAGIDSQHHGTLSLKGGEVSFDTAAQALEAGNFVIDMTSINDLDLTGDGKAQLEAHLRSADFFDVEKYPEASFVLTQAERLDDTGKYRIVGNLTIKDVTNSIEFESTISYDEATKTLTAVSDDIVIDRTKWGVNYSSKNVFKELKDNIIDDQITIGLTLVAKV